MTCSQSLHERETFREYLDLALVDRFVPAGPDDYHTRAMLEAREQAGFMEIR